MFDWQLRSPNRGRKALPVIFCFVGIVGALSTTWSSGAQSLVRCGEAPARAFDFWVGDWKIRQQILREDGTYLELPAKTSVSVALDGCALVEHWEGEVQFFWEGMEKPELMKAISVRAYEPRTKKWYIHWLDTRLRHFDTPYVGAFADSRGEFYREWSTLEGARVGRITFSNASPDSVSWSLAVSSDGRRSWTTMWMMEMARVGK
jgi:hypothetical protein